MKLFLKTLKGWKMANTMWSEHQSVGGGLIGRNQKKKIDLKKEEREKDP